MMYIVADPVHENRSGHQENPALDPIPQKSYTEKFECGSDIIII